MMKKYYLILLCTALCACGGGNKQQAVQSDGSFTIDNSNVITCDFDQVSEERTIPLSEWVDDFQIVRFEDKDDAIFKMWWPHITENYVGIRQSRGAFKLFDRQGKYLGNIGNIGGGPGEYKNLYSEAIDEKNGWIYLASLGWKEYLYKYDLKGKYLDRKSVV